MRVASQSEVAADFAEFVKAAKSGPVVVTSKGKPIAVLLRAEDEEDLERLLMGHSPKLQSILESARKRFRAGDNPRLVDHVRRGLSGPWFEIEGRPCNTFGRGKDRTVRTVGNSRRLDTSRTDAEGVSAEFFKLDCRRPSKQLASQRPRPQSDHYGRGPGIPTNPWRRSGPEPKATPLRRPAMTHWRAGKVRPRHASEAMTGPRSPNQAGGRSGLHYQYVVMVGGRRKTRQWVATPLPKPIPDPPGGGYGEGPCFMKSSQSR